MNFWSKSLVGFLEDNLGVDHIVLLPHDLNDLFVPIATLDDFHAFLVSLDVLETQHGDGSVFIFLAKQYAMLCVGHSKRHKLVFNSLKTLHVLPDEGFHLSFCCKVVGECNHDVGHSGISLLRLSMSKTG